MRLNDKGSSFLLFLPAVATYISVALVSSSEEVARDVRLCLRSSSCWWKRRCNCRLCSSWYSRNWASICCWCNLRTSSFSLLNPVWCNWKRKFRIHLIGWWWRLLDALGLKAKGNSNIRRVLDADPICMEISLLEEKGDWLFVFHHPL